MLKIKMYNASYVNTLFNASDTMITLSDNTVMQCSEWCMAQHYANDIQHIWLVITSLILLVLITYSHLVIKDEDKCYNFNRLLFNLSQWLLAAFLIMELVV